MHLGFLPSKVSKCPEYAVLAKLITEVREKAGISQNELARRLNRAHIIVWRFENARQSPDLVELADIAKATNSDLIELVQAWQLATTEK
jgi:ribosome-binding protein aMBF1 (putative translation factor)